MASHVVPEERPRQYRDELLRTKAIARWSELVRVTISAGETRPNWASTVSIIGIGWSQDRTTEASPLASSERRLSALLTTSITRTPRSTPEKGIKVAFGGVL